MTSNNNQYPLVSIITPSYNQAIYLEDTIQSVLIQNYPNLEYIIIDGGSTDGSVEIIKNYADKYSFIKWITEKDQGQSDGINKGFKIAKGDIVAWLNSDDTYCNGAIYNSVKYLVEHPDVILVYGNANLIDQNNRILEQFPYAEEFSLDRLINHNLFIMQPTAFWRKELFDVIGYLDVDLKYTMDWDFWIRAGSKFKLAYYPVLIANTREYPTTKTFGGGFERLREIRKIFDKYSNRKYPPLYINLIFDTYYKKIYYYSPVIANLFLKFKKIAVKLVRKT